jgi:flagellin-like protein
MLNDLIPDDSDRGQVGIGTLIIFIALVLVAAVAAGVLVNTAGELQSRASDTGDDAQSQVSNQIDVISATGVDTNGNAGVEQIELVVKKSAGSDPIDLEAATIQYQSSSSVQTLIEDSQTGSSDDAAGDTDFHIEEIDSSGTVLDSTDERARIIIDANAIEGGTTSDDLSAGSSVELEIVDQSGASTVYGVNVPDVLTGDYVQV